MNGKSLTIAELRLSRNARQAAEIVLAAHPDVCFTSGRRDVRDQARAMAQNVVRFGSIWLRQTYKFKPMVDRLVNYCDGLEELPGQPHILAEGFYHILVTEFAGRLTKFPHLRGDAFDIAWPRRAEGVIDRERGEAIVQTLEQLPPELELRLILKREGQLDVIHAEFNHLVEAEV